MAYKKLNKMFSLKNKKVLIIGGGLSWRCYE